VTLLTGSAIEIDVAANNIETGFVHGWLLLRMLPSQAMGALVPVDGIVAHALIIENVVVDNPDEAGVFGDVVSAGGWRFVFAV
jgi:hypothetical protein